MKVGAWGNKCFFDFDIPFPLFSCFVTRNFQKKNRRFDFIRSICDQAMLHHFFIKLILNDYVFIEITLE